MASHLLQAHDLRIRVRDALLVNGASLDVMPGDRIALRGASGSGKSLFLRSLCLLYRPESGEIRWKGCEVSDENVPSYRAQVLYLPQKPVFFPGTVEENIQKLLNLETHRSVGKKFDREKTSNWLEFLGKPKNFLGTDVKHLSGGEAQIASLIRAMTLAPEVLCLDEPTSALDEETQLRVEKLIQENCPTYLWITHDSKQAERVASRVNFLREGRWTM